MTTYKDVIDVKVPEPTTSYVPVTNKDLIYAVREYLKYYGYEVNKEHYELGAKKQQMFGVFSIKDPDTELQRCIGFRNSYNKTLPVGLVSGAMVIVCSNLMFEGEILRLRKHTVNVYEDLPNLVNDAVTYIDRTFKSIRKDINRLKEVEVDPLKTTELVADMFLMEDMITLHQLSQFKKNWIDMGKGIQSAWDITNHLTDALKKSHPSERMERQLNVHEYIREKFL